MDTRVKVLILGYLVFAILYASLTPPWETPDEPAHYRYAVQLAERWRPPEDPGIRQRDRFCRDYVFITSNYEWYHPALGYLPAAVAYKLVKALAPRSLPAAFPGFNSSFCKDARTHPTLFLHPTLAPFRVWRGVWGVLIIRVFSSLLGAIVVYATYRIGRLLAMKELGIAAAGMVAFLPQFAFISGSIRNDTLANAIGALLFLLTARTQVSPVKRRQWVAMGILAGAGVLTKLTLVYLLPMVLCAAVLSASSDWRQGVKRALLVILPGLGLVLMYYLAYEEARAAFGYTQAQMRINPKALSPDYWKPFLPMLIELFFARFGWANVVVPSRWIWLVLAIWVLGAFLTVLRFVRSLKKKEDGAALRVIALFAVGLLMAFIGVVRYNLSVFQPQGRFLFPVLAGWAILGTWGASRMFHRCGRRLIAAVLVGFMVLFDLRSLIALILAYY